MPNVTPDDLHVPAEVGTESKRRKRKKKALVLKAKWSEELHPRGWHGRWIKLGSHGPNRTAAVFTRDATPGKPKVNRRTGKVIPNADPYTGDTTPLEYDKTTGRWVTRKVHGLYLDGSKTPVAEYTSLSSAKNALRRLHEESHGNFRARSKNPRSGRVKVAQVAATHTEFPQMLVENIRPANEFAHKYFTDKHLEHALFVLRIGKKSSTAKPSSISVQYREQRAQQTGLSVQDLVAVEQAMKEVMYPKQFIPTSRQRRKLTWHGHSGATVTKAQEEEVKRHGGRSVHVIFPVPHKETTTTISRIGLTNQRVTGKNVPGYIERNGKIVEVKRGVRYTIENQIVSIPARGWDAGISTRTDRNDGILFKATKGPNRGKYVKVSFNGDVSVVTEAKHDSMVRGSEQRKARHNAKQASDRAAADAYKARQEAAKAAEIERQKELGIYFPPAGEETNAERVARLRQEAGRWAESMGFDPTDTYWHAFYHNDQSLLRSQKEDSDPTKYRPIVAPQKVTPIVDIPAYEVGQPRAKPFKGWRYPEHDAFIVRMKPGVFHVYVNGVRVRPAWKSKHEAHNALLKHLQPKGISSIPSADLNVRDYRGRKPVGRGAQTASEKLQKSRYRIRKKHWDVTSEIRDWRGRWTRTPKSGKHIVHDEHVPGKPNNLSIEYPRVPFNGAIDNGILSPAEYAHVGRPDSASNKTANGTVIISRLLVEGGYYLDPGEATYIRSMQKGKGRITNARLAKIYNNPSVATKEEIALLGSAKPSKVLDMTFPEDRKKFRVVSQLDGSVAFKDRVTVIGDIRKKLGTGYKSPNVSDERRAAQREKVRGIARLNSSGQRKRKAQVFEDWQQIDENGKPYVVCVHCMSTAKARRIYSVSNFELEKLNPAKGGGRYDVKGNLAPSHKDCNRAWGQKAIGDAENAHLYLEQVLVNIVKLRDVMSPASYRRIMAKDNVGGLYAAQLRRAKGRRGK